MSMPTQDRLRQLFDYDAETGELVRRVSVRGGGEHFIGGRPKHKAVRGYFAIGVDGTKVLYHRLVWLWHHGKVAPVIDHFDGDQKNNRIENLRACSQAENVRNSQLAQDNVSGFKGVSWHAPAKKWRARVGVDKKQFHLGVYATPEEADAAARPVRSGLHANFANHGTHLKDLV